ncbi:hypothetical protein C8F04DRAFT_1186287 [Mycena alexandri]|uniref:Uncharacterized protein n=1 Tax=Mycena alexandri TaxID=1745969 RepID=A0AAD6X076_9AGAR|nr:hypothetical protein C8F04DRAFT_1186287 [Mycena alexandri]
MQSNAAESTGNRWEFWHKYIHPLPSKYGGMRRNPLGIGGSSGINISTHSQWVPLEIAGRYVDEVSDSHWSGNGCRWNTMPTTADQPVATSACITGSRGRRAPSTSADIPSTLSRFFFFFLSQTPQHLYRTRVGTRRLNHLFPYAIRWISHEIWQRPPDFIKNLPDVSENPPEGDQNPADLTENPVTAARYYPNRQILQRCTASSGGIFSGSRQILLKIRRLMVEF